MHPDIIKVIGSWLQGREVNVVVNGQSSATYALEDMSYQGTVLGHSLWSVMYADAKEPVRKHGFREVAFADDLNAWRVYHRAMPAEAIKRDTEACQAETHERGRNNQVQFDASKESMHVITRCRMTDTFFRLLGITIDTRLRMESAVEELITASRWKIKAVLKMKIVFSVPDIIAQYKAQVLSMIEYRRPVKIMRATPSCLHWTAYNVHFSMNLACRNKQLCLSSTWLPWEQGVMLPCWASFTVLCWARALLTSASPLP